MSLLSTLQGVFDRVAQTFDDEAAVAVKFANDEWDAIKAKAQAESDVVHSALANLATEVKGEAESFVQFAAGDWARIRAWVQGDAPAAPTSAPAPEPTPEPSAAPAPAPADAAAPEAPLV